MLSKSLMASRSKTKILTNHVALLSGWFVTTAETCSESEIARIVRGRHTSSECQEALRFDRARSDCFGWLHGIGFADGRGLSGDGGEFDDLRTQEGTLRRSSGSVAHPWRGDTGLGMRCQRQNGD